MIARVSVVGRRACAVLAACSAVLHGFSLTHATNLASAGLTVAMLAACLFCVRDLWAGGTLRAWVLVALMNLAMIAMHTPGAAAHHHHTGVTNAPAHHSPIMTLATTLAAVEVVLAAVVLSYRTRGSTNTINARSAPAFD